MMMTRESLQGGDLEMQAGRRYGKATKKNFITRFFTSAPNEYRILKMVLGFPFGFFLGLGKLALANYVVCLVQTEGAL